MAPGQTAATTEPTSAPPVVIARVPETSPVDAVPEELAPIVFDVRELSVYYGTFRAVRDASLKIRQHEITAFIGPSGCGKSTMLRCFDRMNDLIEGCRVEGTLEYHGID